MKKWKSRCTAWIACFAILAAAFMPSISAALVPPVENPAFSAPICSVHDAGHSIAGHEQPSSHHSGHADHCPLCAKQGNLLDILLEPDFGVPPLASVSITVAIGQEPVCSAIAWILLPARAPPAHS